MLKEQADVALAQAVEEGKKIKDIVSTNKLLHQLQLAKVQNSLSGVKEQAREESKILKEIETCDVD
jgi:aspartate ammonia-lyase